PEICNKPVQVSLHRRPRPRLRRFHSILVRWKHYYGDHRRCQNRAQRCLTKKDSFDRLTKRRSINAITVRALKKLLFASSISTLLFAGCGSFNAPNYPSDLPIHYHDAEYDFTFFLPL